MGSSKKEKKSKDKKKHKHRSQERSRSRSRERKHRKERKREVEPDRYEPDNKRRREREHNENGAGNTEDKGRRRPSPDRTTKHDSYDYKQSSSSAGGEISMSVQQTNKLRAELGLKPLDAPSDKNDDSGKPKKTEDVHKPAINIGATKKQDVLREKLLAAKEKRRVNKALGKIKTLGESDSDDDAHAWVEKSRRRQQEKVQAEKTAKMLQQMDEEFGIGDLVEEEFGTKKRYGSRDLRGLRVEHGQDTFTEGKTVILTLKDKGVLDEDDADDTLINVNMVDDERTNINIENKKKKLDYKPYDEPEYDEYGMAKEKDILEKYNEEIDGKTKETFELGAGGKYDSVQERRMREMKAELRQQGQSLELPAPFLATEFYTTEEMSFKKVKRKVRTIRKKNKMITADDLVPLGDDEDLGNRRRRRRNQEEGELEEEVEIKKEATIPGLDFLPTDHNDMITDDTEAPEEDLTGVRIEEEGAALELELAIKKTRKLNTKSNRVNILKDIAEKVEIKQEPESESDSEQQGSATTPQRKRGPNIVLDGTSEFCRSLGDIPTYGQAGNRAEEEEDELLDFERALQEERRKLEEMESDPAAPGWQEVEVMETQPVELEEVEERNIMEDEPVLTAGLGAALDLAVRKGYLEREKGKTKQKGSKTRIEADNYSIEDKRYDDLDEKYNRKRDRFSGGMVQDFSEKKHYKPEIKLEYFDEKGHAMNHKEAFRYLSHRFHGKGSGKLKTEKRNKKLDQESLMLSMTSNDTPLNTASMLEGKLKQEKTPYLVLSGSSKSGASSLSKS